MKTFNKLAICSLALIAVVSLTACGAKKSDSLQEDKTSTETVSKKKPAKKEVSKAPAKKEKPQESKPVAESEVSVDKAPATQNGGQSGAANQTPAKPATPAPTNYPVNSPEDAVSLYEFYIGILTSDGGHSYTAKAVPGGFYVVPKEGAYGHEPFVITQNGDLYSSDGKTELAKFAEMAAAKDPNRPEYGWHGF